MATLPTPLEGPFAVDDTGVRLWVKRDDLTGLAGGGNKARKLEFLCGAALEQGATRLVTVGAAQSNHCRMTAAAGARLGLDVHLVLSGDRPDVAHGNLLLDELFGAHLHFTGADARHWGELEIAREALTTELATGEEVVCSIPVGGSTAVGAVGYALAAIELAEQCAASGVRPAAVVTASSSGGTHAGLLAGRALATHTGRSALGDAEIIAIGVAKGVIAGLPDIAELATAVLDLAGVPDPAVAADEVRVRAEYLGDDYAVPTGAGDAAVRWGATTAGLLLDRTYSGKGLSGLLDLARRGHWAAGSDVVFLHTGGWPALFAPGRCATSVVDMSDSILDVDLLAFERGSSDQRRAVVDGVRRSLETGFVYLPATTCPRRSSTTPTACSPTSSARTSTSSSSSSRRERTVRPATPACSSRPQRRATRRTGKRCSTGPVRSRTATR